MSKRITLISFIEKNEISKVEQLMSNITENTCKVPYGIDNDYNKILKMQNTLKQNFKPFFLVFNILALFNYPGDMIKKINLKR